MLRDGILKQSQKLLRNLSKARGLLGADVTESLGEILVIRAVVKSSLNSCSVFVELG